MFDDAEQSPGDNAGFSLIELIVVLAIVAMATLIAWPRASLSGARTLSVFSTEAVAKIRALRSLSISKNRELAITLDIRKKTLTFEGLGGPIELPAGMSAKLTTARDYVRGGSAGQLMFFPDGSSSGGELTLANAEAAEDISVAWLTGSVSTKSSSK